LWVAVEFSARVKSEEIRFFFWGFGSVRELQVIFLT
jgi:hypothetical protein